jgi:hypothetical protein
MADAGRRGPFRIFRKEGQRAPHPSRHRPGAALGFETQVLADGSMQVGGVVIAA